jgi:multiple sugar transport system permease protein
MAQKRPKRLPTDFFDRLLTNQSDDQINDLLTSLVDEQIAPSSVPEEELAPISLEADTSTVQRSFDHDSIEDTIVTRDEALDEEAIPADQESALDELIPRTSQMHAAARDTAAVQEHEAPPYHEPEAEVKLPGAANLEVPPELLSDEPRVPDVPDIPDMPGAPDDETGSTITSAPPPGVHGAPDQWSPEIPDVPDVPEGYEDTAAAAAVTTPELPKEEPFDVSLPDGSEKIDVTEAFDLEMPADTYAVEETPTYTEETPVMDTPTVAEEAPQATVPATEDEAAFSPSVSLPAHEEMVKARMNARWTRRQRQPKKPKLAKASAPITVAPPRADTISDILGVMDKTEEKFRFTKLNRAALMFLLPAFIAFSFFSWYPMVKGFIISLYEYHPIGATTFIGFQNYARAFQDELFWATLLHAAGFCVLVLGLGFLLPIALSIFLNELKLGKGLLKFIFFLPFLMPTVPAAILWKWIMDQGLGLLNSVLSFLPIADPHIGWLTNPKLALLSIVLVYIWKNTGWAILIYSAALGNIDETMYEEAEIDGASMWQKVKHITLPGLRTVISVMLIITIINTIQLFTEVYIMTNGGPMNSTEVIATYIYKQAFFYMDLGYASALSMLMLFMLLIITIFRIRRMNPEGG